jgi:hypothetical protein
MSYYKLLLPALFCLATNALAMNGQEASLTKQSACSPKSCNGNCQKAHSPLQQKPSTGSTANEKAFKKATMPQPSKAREIETAKQIARESEEYFAY